MDRVTPALTPAGSQWRVKAVAKALVVQGLAAAALALFAMAVPVDLDAEKQTDLRMWAGFLLLSATAQVHAALLAVLVPKRPLGWLACMVSAQSGHHAYGVVWRIADAGARGQFQGSLSFYYWLFVAAQLAGFVAGIFISTYGEEE